MINEVFTVELDHTDELSYDVDVRITWFEDVEGDYSTWDSDADYYGYTDLEYDILRCVEWDDGSLVGETELPAELENKLYDAVLEEALAYEEDY
jgi:hypothetical protein